jgi:hypothetical protein
VAQHAFPTSSCDHQNPRAHHLAYSDPPFTSMGPSTSMCLEVLKVGFSGRSRRLDSAVDKMDAIGVGFDDQMHA